MSARVWLLVCGGFVAGIVAALAVSLALSSGSDNPVSLQALEPTHVVKVTVIATSTSTPEPVGTAAPELATPRSCEQIRESGSYQDEAERLRFLGECSPAASPTIPRPAPVLATPTARPPVTSTPSTTALADITGRIELIGAVWPDESLPVRYCVNASEIPVRSNGSKLMTAESFAGLVRTAFGTWESIPESRIAFAYQGLCTTDPLNNRDGVNTVGWGWLYGNAIGLADPSGTNGRFLRQNSTGQLFEVDLVIDIRFAQSFDDPTDYIQRQLPHIILHEAGHFLGLGHASEPCSVMRPSGIGSGLCWVDVAAAAQLYPR